MATEGPRSAYDTVRFVKGLLKWLVNNSLVNSVSLYESLL